MDDFAFESASQVTAAWLRTLLELLDGAGVLDLANECFATHVLESEVDVPKSSVRFDFRSKSLANHDSSCTARPTGRGEISVTSFESSTASALSFGSRPVMRLSRSGHRIVIVAAIALCGHPFVLGPHTFPQRTEASYWSRAGDKLYYRAYAAIPGTTTEARVYGERDLRAGADRLIFKEAPSDVAATGAYRSDDICSPSSASRTAP